MGRILTESKRATPTPSPGWRAKTDKSTGAERKSGHIWAQEEVFVARARGILGRGGARLLKGI